MSQYFTPAAQTPSECVRDVENSRHELAEVSGLASTGGSSRYNLLHDRQPTSSCDLEIRSVARTASDAPGLRKSQVRGTSEAAFQVGLNRSCGISSVWPRSDERLLT